MRSALLVFCGLVIALLLPFALIPLAYLFVALGLSAGLLPVMEWLAPLLSVMAGAYIAGRRSWVLGVVVSGIVVLLWLVVSVFLLSRWRFSTWITEGIARLTIWHLLAWMLALLAGAGAGYLGFRAKGYRFAIPLGFLGILVLYSVVLIGSAVIVPTPRQAEYALADGVTVHYQPPVADGTAYYLLSADFAQNPRLALEGYNADLHDTTPGNDVNTTWLGQPLPYLLPDIERQARLKSETVLSAWNGNFFGYDKQWVGWNLSPFVENGQAHYNVHRLSRDYAEQDWQFGVRRKGGKVRFVLAKDFSWARWQSEFETALGGVRPLRVNGKSVPLRPGYGNTAMQSSRTSLAWTADSSKLYLLIVKELDAEGSSNRQKQAKVRQVGGWSLPQVQQFWESLHLPNAIALDAGESTQLALRDADRYRFVPSGYLTARTLGYVHDKPILTSLLIRPPTQAHFGVMNYLYLAERKASR